MPFSPEDKQDRFIIPGLEIILDSQLTEAQKLIAAAYLGKCDGLLYEKMALAEERLGRPPRISADSLRSNASVFMLQECLDDMLPKEDIARIVDALVTNLASPRKNKGDDKGPDLG